MNASLLPVQLPEKQPRVALQFVCVVPSEFTRGFPISKLKPYQFPSPTEWLTRVNVPAQPCDTMQLSTTWKSPGFGAALTAEADGVRPQTPKIAAPASITLR